MEKVPFPVHLSGMECSPEQRQRHGQDFSDKQNGALQSGKDIFSRIRPARTCLTDVSIYGKNPEGTEQTIQYGKFPGTMCVPALLNSQSRCAFQKPEGNGGQSRMEYSRKRAILQETGRLLNFP